MILTINEIQLIRLSEDHLEQVRKWRNSNEVRSAMEYQKHITKDQQVAWFTSINNLTNFYFVINFENTNGGLINFSQIDYKNGTANSGLFLGEAKFRDTPIPFLSSICLLQFGFNILKLNEIFAKVAVNNTKANNYNAALGFSFSKHINVGFDLLKIDKDSFESNRFKFDRIVGLSSNNKLNLVLNKKEHQTNELLDIINHRSNNNETGFEIIKL